MKILLILALLVVNAGPGAAGEAVAPSFNIGTEQELIRRAEGRVQRSVLDRLLGPGKGRILLDKVGEPVVPLALARLAGKEADQSRMRLSAAVQLEESFVEERLDLVRRELKETLGAYKIDVTEVKFAVRDAAALAIEDAQFAIYEGALDRALKRALEAVKADPDNVTALELLGSVHFLMGHHEDARAAWGRVLQLDPENAQVPGFLERLG